MTWKRYGFQVVGLLCCHCCFFYGSLCLWCGLKRDDTYQCRQLFCSLRNRISHYANLKCDAETLRFTYAQWTLTVGDSRHTLNAHTQASVCPQQKVWFSWRSCRRVLILLMVAVHRLRNRGVGVCTSTFSCILQSLLSPQFPQWWSENKQKNQIYISAWFCCCFGYKFHGHIIYSFNFISRVCVCYINCPHLHCAANHHECYYQSAITCASVCRNSLLLCWYLMWFWRETTVVEFRPELLTAGSLCVILKCCSENEP